MHQERSRCSRGPVEWITPDFQGLADSGSPSAMAVIGSFQLDVLDRALCERLRTGIWLCASAQSGRSTEYCPVSQAIAVLANGAWAPPKSQKLNQRTVKVVNSQRLMIDGKSDHSAAVREINRAPQAAKRSRSALDWDETTQIDSQMATRDLPGHPVRRALILYIGAKRDRFPVP